jgi:O-acetyl-ADP-ribose deacetylase
MDNGILERIHVVTGDITKLAVDVIVNAANSTLLGGGGVDGAIHRSAGPMLLAKCITLGGCATGNAKITPGYRLPAKHVIHTVGPVYGRGGDDKAALLASCYQRSLELAEEHGLASVAFPCVSTGVYGYPKVEACAIAVKVVSEWLGMHALPESVTFCCFSEADAGVYCERLEGEI